MAQSAINGEDIEDSKNELAEEVDQDKDHDEGELWELLNWHDQRKWPDYETAEPLDEFDSWVVWRIMIVGFHFRFKLFLVDLCNSNYLNSELEISMTVLNSWLTFLFSFAFLRLILL